MSETVAKASPARGPSRRSLSWIAIVTDRCVTRNGRCSLAEWPRHWPSDADEEILDAAHAVRQFAGRVKVMTRDLGHSYRATSEGLEVLVLPEERPSGDTTEWSDA